MLRTLVLAFLAGCASHVTGLVHAGAEPTSLQTAAGREYRLILVSEGTSPLGLLDGQIAEVEGPRMFGAIQVRSWTVREGTHGMPAFVGVLRRQGVQLAIEDRNTGSFYFFDADPELAKLADHLVLVEGYADGPQRIRAVSWIDLGAPVPPG